jgi:hypothetical protein
MIVRTVIPHGWYVDVDGVDGAYAALITDTHIQTATGTIPLPNNPPENVLYVRAFGGKVCGVGNRSDLAWEWDGAVWIAYQLISGVSPCIYDLYGHLLLAPTSVGSQGYRYVDEANLPVSGDDTYNSATPLAQSYGLEGLWEWTKQGDLFVGQNSADECVIVGPIGRRLLDSKVSRFIRFIRSGDRCAVGIWHPEENHAEVITFAVADIASLPIEDLTPPEPPIDPPDPPEVPVLVYDFTDVQKFADTRWAQLPHGTRLEQQEAFFRIAWEWAEKGHRETQVFQKGKTDTTFQASDGKSYAEDIWVIDQTPQGNGKWQADCGENFGAPNAKINFNKAWAPPNGNDAAMCVAPPKPAGVVVPPVEPPVPPVEPPTDPFWSEATFNLYIDSAGAEIVQRAAQVGLPIELVHAKQKARGAGDRYRSHGVNPTLSDLVWGGWVEHISKVPLDAATVLDPMVADIVAEEARLEAITP